MSRPKRAIIIAAGLGSRLAPYTEETPKCLLKVGDKSMLDHGLAVLKKCGVNEIALVKGYRAETIQLPELRYFYNMDFRNNNILQSLFHAVEFMNEPFLALYSDILYSADVVEAALESKADIGVVVDRDWKKAYEGRSLHPYSEAEVVFDRDGKIELIGKGSLSPEEASGEFIGMAKFSKQGAQTWKKEFERLSLEYKEDMDRPFQRAKAFRKAYLTDLFQEITNRKIPVTPIEIHGGWMEIDTVQDYDRAQVFVRSNA